MRIFRLYNPSLGFPGGSVVKYQPTNAGDTEDAGSIPGLGRFPGDGNGNSLQYSCLAKSIDREGWQATICKVAENQTQLSN